MSKELTVEEWVSEIDNGLEFRRLYGLEDQWASLEALYYSVHPSSTYAGPNIISSTGDSVLAQLNVPVPTFLVKPKRPNMGQVSRVLESVDNTLLREVGLDKEVEQASLHAFLWGKGILKFGYDSEYGYSPNFVLDEDLGLTLTQFDIKENRIEYSGINPGMPWVKACLPHDIVVPYGTLSLDDARWTAHRVIRHIEDIKADVKYSKKKELQPMMSMDDYVKSYTSVVKPYRVGAHQNYYANNATGKSEFCELWEIHDRKTGKIIVIATGHKSFLRNENDLLQLDGLPFIDFNFVPNARTFWVTPDSYYLKPFQSELSDIVQQASKQRRLSVLKFLYSGAVISDQELEKILSPDVGAGARVEDGQDLKNAILPLTMPNNNPQLYNDAEYTRRSARETIGFSRNQMGEFEATGRHTATESNNVKESSGVRMGRREKTIKGVYEKSIRKINGIIFTFWKGRRWAEVAGTNGAEWIEYNGEMLKGDYAYNVTFAPGDIETTLQRQRFAMQVFQVFAADPNIDKQKLLTFIINAFDDRELSDLFGNIEDMSLPSNQQQTPQGGGQKTPQSNQFVQGGNNATV